MGSLVKSLLGVQLRLGQPVDVRTNGIVARTRDLGGGGHRKYLGKVGGGEGGGQKCKSESRASCICLPAALTLIMATSYARGTDELHHSVTLRCWVGKVRNAPCLRGGGRAGCLDVLGDGADFPCLRGADRPRLAGVSSLET